MWGYGESRGEVRLTWPGSCCGLGPLNFRFLEAERRYWLVCCEASNLLSMVAPARKPKCASMVAALHAKKHRIASQELVQ